MQAETDVKAIEMIEALKKKLPEVWECMLSLPSYMYPGVAGYVMCGNRPGDFMIGVLSNDPFADVVCRADATNYRLLREWAYLTYALPMLATGSKENVEHWIDAGGYLGHRPHGVKA